MNTIPFPEQTTTYAKDQPQYSPLPAHIDRADPNGTVTCCWRMSWRERLTVLVKGVIWHQVWTFHKPLQPQLLTVDKPELPAPGPVNFADLKNEIGR